MILGRHADADRIGVGEQFSIVRQTVCAMLLAGRFCRPRIQIADSDDSPRSSLGLDADVVLPHRPDANDADIHIIVTL